jgi:hypothetical protein
MRPQRASLAARKGTVELAGDRPLGLIASQRPLELLAQTAARAEQQCLNRRARHLQQAGDLGHRSALELTHHQRRPLVKRKMRQRPDDVRNGGPWRLDHRLAWILLERDLVGPAARPAKVLAADVERNRPQPASRMPRALAPLERSVRVQERRLRRVLRVGGAMEQRQRVAEDLPEMAPIQRLERLLGRPPRDPAWPQYVLPTWLV